MRVASRQQRWPTALVAMAGSLVAACSGLLGCGRLSAAEAAIPSCKSNKDCTSTPGATCVQSNTASGATAGVCVVASSTAVQSVYLEVRSVGDSAFPVQQFGPLLLSNGATQNLVLPAFTNVAGTVAIGASQPVPGASVFFTPHNGIPNRPLAPFQTQTGSTGSFDLLLPQNSYSVVVYGPPTSAGLASPPQYFPDVSPSDLTPSELSKQMALVAWDPTQLVELSGTVTLAGGGSAVGIEVGAASGTATNGAAQPLAQAVLTDATAGDMSAGEFVLLLPPPPLASVQLQFGPGTPTGIPFPTMDYPQTIPMPPPPLVAASLNVASATVQGTVYDASGLQVTNATVLLLTQPSATGVAPPFSFQSFGTTDVDDGHYNASVFTTDPYDPYDAYDVYYSVVAVPAPSAAVAGGPGLCRPVATSSGTAPGNYQGPTLVKVPHGASSVTADLICDTIVQFSGVVVTNSQAAPPRAPVPATVVQALLEPTVELPAGLSFQATADSSGTFVILLPAGTYDLTFTPPSGTPQPFSALAGQPMTPETTNATTSNRIPEYPLPLPFVLSGVLSLGDTTHPIAAQVDVYEILGANALHAASCLTGPDGQYSLVLSSSGQ